VIQLKLNNMKKKSVKDLIQKGKDAATTAAGGQTTTGGGSTPKPKGETTTLGDLSA
jgi:hypothetical protein